MYMAKSLSEKNAASRSLKASFRFPFDRYLCKSRSCCQWREQHTQQQCSRRHLPPSEGTREGTEKVPGEAKCLSDFTQASHLGKKVSWLVHTFMYIHLGKTAAKSP